jgi:hypothetical protein
MGTTARAAASPRNDSHASSIELRLAHLAWRKQQTDRQIQSALSSARTQQQRDASLQKEKAAAQRAQRMQQLEAAVRDELEKPLKRAWQ